MILRASLVLALALPVAWAASAGTITGTIRSAETQNPLGAKVVAAYDTTGTLRGTATSDATGLYVLTLPAGSYRLLAYDLEGVYATMFDANAESFETSPLTNIGATDEVHRDFSLVIGGTVSGVVAGSGSAPLSDMVVEAYNPSGTRRGFTTTNAQGQYSIVLPPGDYKLVAYDPLAHYAFGFYKDALAFSEATPVTVRAAQASGASFRLSLAARITGVVTDAATGLPLNAIDVYAYTTAGALVASARTTANGTFSLTVPPGAYRIVAADPARQFATGFHGNANAFESSSIVNVGGGGQVSAAVALTRAATIAGVVRDANGGAVVPNVTVAAYNLDGTLHTSANTAADGSYELLVAPGTYKLLVFDAQLNYATRFFGGARDFNATGPVGLAGGQHLTGFNFSILRGGRITGTVRDGAQPRAGITVAAYDSAGSLVASAVTGADGTYAFVVPPGDYRIVAFDPAHGYAPSYDGSTNSFDQSIPRTINAGATVTADIGLRRGFLVSGDVFNSAGEPLNDVNVFALDGAGNRVAGAVTREGTFSLVVPSGAYKFVAIDGPGRYDVTYWQHAKTLATAEWVTVSTQTPRLVFELEQSMRRRATRH